MRPFTSMGAKQIEKQKRPNKGSAKTGQPKAESYFDTRDRTDTSDGTPSMAKNMNEMSESERKRCLK